LGWKGSASPLNIQVFDDLLNSYLVFQVPLELRFNNLLGSRGWEWRTVGPFHDRRHAPVQETSLVNIDSSLRHTKLINIPIAPDFVIWSKTLVLILLDGTQE